MPDTQTRIIRHACEQGNSIVQGDNRSIETDPEIREIMEVAVKDIKRAIINTLSLLKEVM